MDIETTFKTIQNLYKTLAGGTDNDVVITYKGNSYGVTKPWKARVDAREFSHETYAGALNGLLAMLKSELEAKVKSTEQEAKRLKQIFNQLDN